MVVQYSTVTRYSARIRFSSHLVYPLSAALSLSLVRFQGITPARRCANIPSPRIGHREVAHGVAQTVSKEHKVTTIEKPTIPEVAAKSRDITKFHLVSFSCSSEQITEILRRIEDETFWLVRTFQGQVKEIAQVRKTLGAYLPVEEGMTSDEAKP